MCRSKKDIEREVIIGNIRERIEIIQHKRKKRLLIQGN
jgi:hypothetical protein